MGFKETCQGFPPARFVMAFMAFTGYINVYIVRNNINLAIVAMVNYTAIREEVNPSNDSLIPEEKQCEFQTVNSTDTSEDGPFPWSEPIQALISTSFLWGYFITNIPGGRLAEIFGTKYLLAISQILASALTMLIPIAASVGWELIIVIRVTMGLVQGPSFPCMHPLLAKWIPPQDRGTISAVVYAGQQLGTVVGLLLTGLIINKLGWEAVFYIEGCIGFVWTFFWLLLVFDSPDTHPRISKAEKKYIRTSIANDASPTKKVASVPWKDIFTSLPFYAILIANIGHNWGFLILLTELPIYMKNILGFDIKSNSMATAFPYFLTWLASIAVSPLADLCKQKEWLSTVWIRKIFTLIGHMGPAVCLTAVAFAGCDLTLILVMLTLSVSLQAGIYAGWFINHIDIASNFAGTLFGLTNGLSIIPSWIGPLVVGFITKGNQTIEAWQIVFLLAAVVLGFDAVFFLIFASGDEQPWNKEATKQRKKEDTRESMKCFDAGTTDTKSEAQKTAQKDLKCPSTS